jgi:hypothetical protein
LLNSDVFFKFMKLNCQLFDSNLENVDSSNKEKGLSELVRLCFGKPLNKAEQISNWERRPLRKSQIYYAGKFCYIVMFFEVKIICFSLIFSALDAYCLVEIFYHLKNKIEQAGLNFDIHNNLGKAKLRSVATAGQSSSSRSANVTVDETHSVSVIDQNDQSKILNAQQEERNAEIAKFLVNFALSKCYFQRFF